MFYGTRTLKQEIEGAGAAPEGVVRDEPAKQRRGLMLDTARKFYTADWIEDRIRELGDLKFNEIGLHFSDDQGFRVRVRLASGDRVRAAPDQGAGEEIVDLAESRHITVVPEIDSPGHLGAVIAAHPDLQLRDADGDAVRGAIDISKPAAEIVDDLLDEYAGLFPGGQWHMGGDEYRRWWCPTPRRRSRDWPPPARERYGSGATVEDLTTGWLNDRAATVRGHDRTPRA
ncbi:hypothetical protein GCM10023238_12190 [Streptomyces heliomycini]